MFSLSTGDATFSVTPLNVVTSDLVLLTIIVYNVVSPLSDNTDIITSFPSSAVDKGSIVVGL